MPRQETILIVDDEPMTRDVLEGFLFSEGYDLLFAASGGETLAVLEESSPDLVLLDVMMPGMDGFEVCQHLKATQQWRHIPIILVTALDSKADLARGLEAGADDFLHKPVNELELRARIHSMLRIKRQYDELQAAMRLREDLARMLVHDIRNPLAVIMSYSGLLSTKEDGPIDVLLNGFKKISAQSLRLEAFLNDMLLLAKMESGQLLLNCSSQDVNALVKKVAESYEIVAESKGLKLVIDLPAASRQVSLDNSLVQRVLDNLISNAFKFSPLGGTVTIRVEYPSEAKVRLKVLDEGPGIPPEHRERIFDKFQIVNLKQKSVPQVGLGLAFCKMVVEAHRGRILVQPNKPVGAAFVVEI